MPTPTTSRLLPCTRAVQSVSSPLADSTHSTSTASTATGGCPGGKGFVRNDDVVLSPSACDLVLSTSRGGEMCTVRRSVRAADAVATALVRRLRRGMCRELRNDSLGISSATSSNISIAHGRRGWLPTSDISGVRFGYPFNFFKGHGKSDTAAQNPSGRRAGLTLEIWFHFPSPASFLRQLVTALS